MLSATGTKAPILWTAVLMTFYSVRHLKIRLALPVKGEVPVAFFVSLRAGQQTNAIPLVRVVARSRRRTSGCSSPQLAIQLPILDRLTDVLRGNVSGAGEVCDGTRDFQDAVVGACAE